MTAKQEIAKAKRLVKQLKKILEESNSLTLHFGYWKSNLRAAVSELNQGIEYNEVIAKES